MNLSILTKRVNPLLKTVEKNQFYYSWFNTAEDEQNTKLFNNLPAIWEIFSGPQLTLKVTRLKMNIIYYVIKERNLLLVNNIYIQKMRK
jgi:hypothetical protein